MFFFFNDTATTEIYTLSLHDALPISVAQVNLATGMRRDVGLVRHEHDGLAGLVQLFEQPHDFLAGRGIEDRKSTRLNSSHSQISYAVFCLKKKTTARSGAPRPPPAVR